MAFKGWDHLDPKPPLQELSFMLLRSCPAAFEWGHSQGYSLVHPLTMSTNLYFISHKEKWTVLAWCHCKLQTSQAMTGCGKQRIYIFLWHTWEHWKHLVSHTGYLIIFFFKELESTCLYSTSVMKKCWVNLQPSVRFKDTQMLWAFSIVTITKESTT